MGFNVGDKVVCVKRENTVFQYKHPNDTYTIVDIETADKDNIFLSLESGNGEHFSGWLAERFELVEGN